MSYLKKPRTGISLVADEQVLAEFEDYLQDEQIIERSTMDITRELKKLGYLDFYKEIQKRGRELNNSQRYELLSTKVGSLSVYDYLKSVERNIVIDKLRHLLSMPEFYSGDHLLDVGCGSGLESVFLAGLVRQGKVVGIDYSSGFIEISKERAQRRKVNNLEFVQANFEEIPYLSESFNGIFCINALYDPPDNPEEDYSQILKRRLTEMNRVLNPGGSLFFVVSHDGTKEAVERAINFQKNGLKKFLESWGYTSYKFDLTERRTFDDKLINYSYFCMSKG